MSKPAAEITRLEDSPAWIDQRLVRAYWQTTYRVWPEANFRPADPLSAGAMDGLDLRLGLLHPALEAWLEQHDVSNYIFLSAWNPRSQPLPEAENARRHRALEARLRTVAQLLRPALGIGDQGDWEPEPGFFAAGLDPDATLLLGREFGQNALVFGEKDRPPHLWWLQAPTPES